MKTNSAEPLACVGTNRIRKNSPLVPAPPSRHPRGPKIARATAEHCAVARSHDVRSDRRQYNFGSKVGSILTFIFIYYFYLFLLLAPRPSEPAKLAFQLLFSLTGATRKRATALQACGHALICELRTSPPAWSSSVADFNNWRVIDRRSVSLLSDVVSQLQGYAAVRLWFMYAVPKLSEYIVIPESRTLHARFKAVSFDGGIERIAQTAVSLLYALTRAVGAPLWTFTQLLLT